MKRDPTDAIFTALADATRRRVIRALSEQGPATATGLAANLPVTRQAVTKHLRVLENTGLVRHEKRGREVLYELDPERLQDARAFIDTVSARWDRAIERLRRLVE